MLLFFCMLKKKKYILLMFQSYVSKHYSNCEKQVILLMISNGEKLEVKSSEGCEVKFKRRKSEEWQQWYYLAVKKLSP